MSAEHNSKNEKNRSTSRFLGYRVIEFTQISKAALREVADRLIPHKEEIIERWTMIQFSIWRPPTFSSSDLKNVFRKLFFNMLDSMSTGELENYVTDLEIAGANLAHQNFPYEALIVSVHFLEESYMQYLFEPPTNKMLELMIAMDEFLHIVLATLATSYFEAYRKGLLEEAESGRIIQEALLPDIPGRIAGLETSYIYLLPEAQAKVGGDIIDLFMLDDRKVAFIIADFSGHGLKTAIDAAMLRSLFRGFMRENPDLVDTVIRLNQTLSAELTAGQFVTAIVGTYKESGQLQLINAGHPPPIICGVDCYTLESNGMALAIDKESNYLLNEVKFDTEALFVSYTDGLTEAKNGTSSFGEKRVIDTIEKIRNAPPRAIVEHLRDEVLRYSKGKLMDDVAILALRRIK